MDFRAHTGPPRTGTPIGSLRLILSMLDDQLLADRASSVQRAPARPERAAELFALECHPRRYAAALRHLDCLDDHLLGAARSATLITLPTSTRVEGIVTFLPLT